MKTFETKALAEELQQVASLLAFLLATALIFRSWEFGLIVTASLGFHELGHALALRWHRVDFRISFGLAGAWTWSPLQERSRLSHLANTLIHLAGPVFSLLLAGFALGLQAAWFPADQHLGILADFSAQVCLLNLLPLGPVTDGGKMVRRMIASLEKGPRAVAVLLPAVITTLILVTGCALELPFLSSANPEPYLLGLLLVGLWIAASLFYEACRASQRISPPPDSPSAPMTPRQVYLLILSMWLVLVVGLYISAATPFWLAPQYVLGSLTNIKAVVRIFIHVVL